MKLDMELVRGILFQVEDCTDRTGLREPIVEETLQDVLDYHVVYCVQSGLIEGAQLFTNGRRTYMFLNLTPFGHEFVIEARNDTLWNAAKDQIRQKGLPATIDVIKTVLGGLIKNAIGLN